MKDLKESPPAQSGRTVIFLLVMVFVVVSCVFHTNIYAGDPTKPKGKIMEKSTTQDDPPEIGLNHTNLNFGAVKKTPNSTSSSTPPQTLLISNTGGGTFDWSLHNDEDWLIVSPTSGTGSGSAQVYAATCPLPPGNHKTTISVYAHGAINSPQKVSVNVNVYGPGADAPPFGDFATPTHNSTVRSSIPVTGWALDDVNVNDVKIYNGSDYVGDAVFVEGPRPDVEQAFPDYPNNYKAGWGYMMLTNFLPNGGNGTYHIKAVATDSEGHQTTLGTKTIYCDNEHAVKPFGAIDTPSQGGTASGSSYINWGWALTPQPKHIPTDGSTINVYVDSVGIGHPHYNNYRKDIAQLFPDNANSDGAAGYFYFDTTGYADGVHTIYWTATDNEGSRDGIGSRYFSISNTDGGDSIKTTTVPQNHKYSPPIRVQQLKDLPIDYRTPVKMRKGFREDIPPRDIYADHNGLIQIEIKELERIEIDLSASFSDTAKISGYLLAGNRLLALPIGSTLKDGVFYWIPGLAYLGKYRLVFIEHGPDGVMNRKDVMVKIGPKYEK
jgi:hypothetical protein